MHSKYGIPIRPVIIPIGPSIAYVDLTKGLYSLIDSDDAERVGETNWCAQKSKRKTGEFYAVRNTSKPGRHTLPLHRFILGLEFGDKRLGDHPYSRSQLRQP